MRKIVVVEFLSLDGVMQAPGGSEEDMAEGFEYGGWTAPYFDDFAGQEMAKQMESADLLLGRKTFDIFEAYWPQNEKMWPGVNDVNKYVLSNTRQESKWNNTFFLKDIHGIEMLKNQKGRDMQIYGSSILVQSLMKKRMVDELWLKIFPVILGKGKRLFSEEIPPTAFTLTHSVTSPSGVIFANYRLSGEVKTGSFE